MDAIRNHSSLELVAMPETKIQDLMRRLIDQRRHSCHNKSLDDVPLILARTETLYARIKREFDRRHLTF
jgi:hypothetical protein